jgi:3-methyladenine DNA glycosylase Tag
MLPITFQVIEEAALLRHGSAAIVERLPKPKGTAELEAIPDDRWLSTMTRRVFQAGLKHELVDNKWPAFEAAFGGFVPERVAGLHDEDLEAMLQDKRLIRHMGKLQATRLNARAMCEIAAEHGSFAGYVAKWPTTDIIGLWADLARRMKHLGGNSGPYFLRMMGKDTFILTDSVIRSLAHWQAFDGPLKSRAAQAKLQDVFNAWHAETGKPLGHLSMILAMSVD